MDISFNDVVDTIHRWNDAKSVSLPQFVRPAVIESPNFMQESLIEEPIVNSVIKSLYNIYTGYILMALHMNEMVVGNRRVRDMLGTVSTTSILSGGAESFMDPFTLAKGLSAGIEEFEPNVGGSIQSTKHVQDARTEMPISSGRQMEVKFDAGSGREPITVMLNVKFNTRLIPDQVVDYLVNANFDLAMSKRWLQMQSGEIKFFRDFVFNLDKLDRRANALKHDKNNALQDIFRYQNNASFRQVFKLAIDHNKSYNLANSVLMLDEFTAKKYAKQSGFNFDNLRDRKRFFASTFNLFIVLIDSRYSRVSIYTNGIDQSASFSFNDMKSAANSDKMSIKEVMEYFSKGQQPRF
jgi:hypothetical protein